MTFRTRVAAAIGVVVAAAVFLACYFAYREARSALEGSADSALHQAFEQIYSSPPKLPSIITLGNSDVPWMFVDGQGDSQGTARFLKIDATIEAVAKGKLGVQYRTVTSDNGYALRELIQPIAAGTYVNLDNGQLAGQLASPAALVLVVQFGGIVDRLASLREDLLILAALGVV
ncbi:MAG TPA: hypothetical protein VKT18_08650, partial [Acidimicrobiales bacterium]|nr:hypothetical protein [Acidimicrobiales bacterium]